MPIRFLLYKTSISHTKQNLSLTHDRVMYRAHNGKMKVGWISKVPTNSPSTKFSITRSDGTQKRTPVLLSEVQQLGKANDAVCELLGKPKPEEFYENALTTESSPFHLLAKDVEAIMKEVKEHPDWDIALHSQMKDTYHFTPPGGRQFDPSAYIFNTKDFSKEDNTLKFFDGSTKKPCEALLIFQDRLKKVKSALVEAKKATPIQGTPTIQTSQPPHFGITAVSQGSQMKSDFDELEKTLKKTGHDNTDHPLLKSFFGKMKDVLEKKEAPYQTQFFLLLNRHLDQKNTVAFDFPDFLKKLKADPLISQDGDALIRLASLATKIGKLSRIVDIDKLRAAALAAPQKQPVFNAQVKMILGQKWTKEEKASRPRLDSFYPINFWLGILTKYIKENPGKEHHILPTFEKLLEASCMNCQAPYLDSKTADAIKLKENKEGSIAEAIHDQLESQGRVTLYSGWTNSVTKKGDKTHVDGHATVTELYGDAKTGYYLKIFNAGEAVYRQGRFGKYKPVSVFKLDPSQTSVKDVIHNFVKYSSADPLSSGKSRRQSLYYDFARANHLIDVTKTYETRTPFKPQNLGNCTVRSPEELILDDLYHLDIDSLIKEDIISTLKKLCQNQLIPGNSAS